MLVGKLKNSLELIIQVSPIKTEKRVVDSLHIMPLAYTLNAPNNTFHVYMLKEEIAPKNEASDVLGEGQETKKYKLQKIFYETMTKDELSNWGTDDKSLYNIFADKYQVEIIEYDDDGSLI